MKFEELNVEANIVRALKELSIVEPTQIQEKAIPIVHSGKDLIGMSRTGSGKTAAFGIPILEKVDTKQGLQILVMAPTRELACQISAELQKFGKYTKCRIATVYGGVSLGPQIDQINRAHIVVGTPGRLCDHLGRGNLNLSNLTCFVLDEADKMVEMGFIEDIETMLSYTPKNRQILLFGATISGEIDKIKQRHMNQPVIAEAESQVKQELLEQYFYNTKQHEKFSLLVHLLNKEKIGRAIIFCSTRATVEIVSKNLRNQGIKSEMIHGKLTQNRRLRVIDNFNKGKVEMLVASSVAARGLHIDDVTHVFNYDLSRDPQEYIHRIGRTARAGESGKAITLLSTKDHSIFADILHRYKVDVKELPNEEFPRLKFDLGRNDSFGGRNRNSRNDRDGFRPRRNSRSGSNGFRSRSGSRSSGNSFRSDSNGGGNFRSRDNSRSSGNNFRSDSNGGGNFRSRDNSRSSGNSFRSNSNGGGNFRSRENSGSNGENFRSRDNSRSGSNGFQSKRRGEGFRNRRN